MSVKNTADVIQLIDDGATYMDVVTVADGARIDSRGIGLRLDYFPDEGASVTVVSSLNGWLNATLGSTVISEWDGEDENRFFVTARHYGARVILRGWPDEAVENNRHLLQAIREGLPVVREDLPVTPTESAIAGDIQVFGPPHYVWLGEALVAQGAPESTSELQSWHLLDAIAPTDPHVWNAMKYLMRLGRKGGEEKRLEDLRKAAVYLERAIQREYRRAHQ